MRRPFEYRRLGRASLRWRWGIAIAASFLAGLLSVFLTALGILALVGPEYTAVTITIIFFTFTLDVSGFYRFLYGSIDTLAMFPLFGVLLLLMAAAFFVAATVLSTGHRQFTLNLIDFPRRPSLKTLFGSFRDWKTISLGYLLSGLYTFLWSLLLIVPGIITRLNYAMVPFVLADKPYLSAREALQYSKSIMKGKRLRYLSLMLSLTGWYFLSILTFGIGFFWLIPYRESITAIFYREASGTEYQRFQPKSP